MRARRQAPGRRLGGVEECAEDGAVAVEFALILPILAMLLVGVLTAGISLSHGLGLTNAVREGSRFGATAPFDSSAATEWANAVIARTRATQFDDPSEDSKVCVDLLKKDSGTLVSACDGSGILASPGTFAEPEDMPENGCAVRVWAAREFTINAILLSWHDRVMTRQSIAVYERLPCGDTTS